MDRRPGSLPVAATPLSRVLGEVVWFAGDRGFGFIRPDDGGEDVFVTWGDLPGAGFRSVVAGQRLTFLRDSDPHGPTARDVELLSPPPGSADAELEDVPVGGPDPDLAVRAPAEPEG